MDRKLISLVVVTVAMGSLACVEQKRPALRAEDRDMIKQLVTKNAPHPAHVVNGRFGDKITLLGYDVSPERVNAGENVTFKWYWKAEKDVDRGWRLFTHVADAAGTSRINQDQTGFIREKWQADRWKAGEYIVDEQTFLVPADWGSESIVLLLGLWNPEKDDKRMPVTVGSADSENRLRAATVAVTAAAPSEKPAAAAPPPSPSMSPAKATAAVRIDGKLDDAAWASAVSTPAFVDTMTGGASPVRATAKVTWDDTNLYVGFDVTDTYLKTRYKNRDDELWNDDVVEVFLDPDADGRNYFEIQVSPTNVVFDTRYDSRRNPAAPGHVDWNSQVRSQVTRRGTANDDDADQGYTVELALPWAAFAAGEPAAGKPAPGATWGMNLYVMDMREEDGQAAGAWSPVRVPDFHATDRFGRITFGAPTVVAAPPSGIQVPTGQPTAQPALNPAVMEHLRAAIRQQQEDPSRIQQLVKH